MGRGTDAAKTVAQSVFYHREKGMGGVGVPGQEREGRCLAGSREGYRQKYKQQAAQWKIKSGGASPQIFIFSR